jgi:anthranilate phosphoribosyltransferase
MSGTSLAEKEAYSLLLALTDERQPAAIVAAILTALQIKGVRAAELRGFANAMRALAHVPKLPDVGPTVDIVGTGGDSAGTFNLSTGAALLAAAAGAKVVKHGNRSVSSRSGSADLLQALGLPVPLDASAVALCLQELGFTFLYAPMYHPAMRAIAPVRAALGIRTVFNVLGPLTNPTAPPFHVIGAYSSTVARLMADAVLGLPFQRTFVIHGDPGWDEPSPAGPFLLLDVADGRIREEVRSCSDYGLPSCRPEDLQGGSPEFNAAALLAVFRGNDTGPHRDALIMGAALALEVSGLEQTPRAAAARAASAIDTGAASALLTQMSALPVRLGAQ